jgi:hypothetical protein
MPLSLWLTLVLGGCASGHDPKQSESGSDSVGETGDTTDSPIETGTTDSGPTDSGAPCETTSGLDACDCGSAWIEGLLGDATLCRCRFRKASFFPPKSRFSSFQRLRMVKKTVRRISAVAALR